MCVCECMRVDVRCACVRAVCVCVFVCFCVCAACVCVGGPNATSRRPRGGSCPMSISFWHCRRRGRRRSETRSRRSTRRKKLDQDLSTHTQALCLSFSLTHGNVSTCVLHACARALTQMRSRARVRIHTHTHRCVRAHKHQFS